MNCEGLTREELEEITLKLCDAEIYYDLSDTIETMTEAELGNLVRKSFDLVTGIFVDGVFYLLDFVDEFIHYHDAYGKYEATLSQMVRGRAMLFQHAFNLAV